MRRIVPGVVMLCLQVCWWRAVPGCLARLAKLSALSAVLSVCVPRLFFSRVAAQRGVVSDY